jgi:5-methylcytosine-specific restriction endonuclease McrA
MTCLCTKTPRLRLALGAYDQLRERILRRDGWRCQNCGSLRSLEVHHVQRRSQQGDDTEQNLITLCRSCHTDQHAFCR